MLMMKRKRLGFTLLELLMVVVVVIVAGVIVGPRLVNFLSTWDLETEAKKVRSYLRMGQQLATSRQGTCRVSFNLNSHSYEIRYDPAGANELVDLGSLENPASLKNNIQINSTTFTSNRVDFDSFGAPDPSGGDIVLKDTRGNTSPVTVSIASATGRVTIQ